MFIDALESELNKSYTENGALGLKTTKSELVDFNFKIASYRNKSDNEIICDFKKVWGEDKELALKYLFFARDVRQGLGERRLFRVCLKEIYKELDDRMFDWIMEFGRADDFVELLDTDAHDRVIDFIKLQLTKDMANSLLSREENRNSVSLLAKWLPSINTSSKKTRAYAKDICRSLGLDQRHYRKVLSQLRKYLDVVEKKMCAQKYSEINYNTVPSQANLKYKDAFLKHDEQRRRNYLASLEKGEAKINSSVVFPHDIVNKYCYNYKITDKDIVLEEMWKRLPNYVNGSANTLVVRDGSGSMQCTISGNTKAIDVATALSIYFSERCEGQFKDKFITFSSNPEFVDLHNLNNLHDKLRECYRYCDISNTDIEKTFDLVLNVAVKNKLKQEEIPNLLIISDMEFDDATTTYWDKKGTKTLFETIAAKFNNYGYVLPKLIFWNVNSRTNTIPLAQNDLGVILVSGFSPAITKIVLSEETSPYKALVKELMSDRYKEITLANS